MSSANGWSGGYSAVTAQKMANVELPLKICCSSCKKWKAPGAFSKKQLSDLRYKILQFGKPSSTSIGLVKCRPCTGQQVTELACSVCDEVKGLDDFAFAQRRNPDGARCRNCVEEVLGIEPGNEGIEVERDDDEKSNPYYEDDDETTTSADGGAPLDDPTSGLNSLRLEALEQETGTSKILQGSAGKVMSRETSEDGVSTYGTTTFASTRSDIGDGGVYTGQVREKAGTRYTAYDSHGIAHSRIRAPSTTVSTERGASPRTLTYSSARNQDKFPRPSPLPVKFTPKAEPERRAYNVAARPNDDEEDSDDEDFLGEPV